MDWSLIVVLSQRDIVNDLQLLTAKPVTYLINLSEKDYLRKKNKWYAFVYWYPAFVTGLTSISGIHRLAKIKAWIDTNNPGDLLIPYSVSLEERLALMDSPEDQAKELEAIGGTSALGKITTAGYASLHVSWLTNYFARQTELN